MYITVQYKTDVQLSQGLQPPLFASTWLALLDQVERLYVEKITTKALASHHFCLRLPFRPLIPFDNINYHYSVRPVSEGFPLNDESLG